MKYYRRTFGTINVDVDVDVDDILSEISTKDLLEYVRERDGIAGSAADEDSLQRVYDAVKEGRNVDALAYLERIMSPKFSSLPDCLLAYSKAKDRNHVQ